MPADGSDHAIGLVRDNLFAVGGIHIIQVAVRNNDTPQAEISKSRKSFCYTVEQLVVPFLRLPDLHNGNVRDLVRRSNRHPLRALDEVGRTALITGFILAQDGREGRRLLGLGAFGAKCLEIGFGISFGCRGLQHRD